MRWFSVIIALALSTSAASAQRFTVGTASAAPGETGRGSIAVPAGLDSGLTVAVAVIHGARPGPVVALVAGSHGTEYTSIVALQRLIGRLDPKSMAGTVIVVPLVNVPSFRLMTPHLNPVDGKGMNRVYPGNRQGTQTERTLAVMADEVVKPAQVVIDLHGGDLDEDLRPYTYWFRGGNAPQDSASKALALAFGLDHIIVDDVDLSSPASRGTLSGYALSVGKTVLVAEAGRSGTVAAEDLELLERGVVNALAALRVVDRAVHPVEQPVWLDGGTRVAADGDGVFAPQVARGSFVKEGMRIGTITDFLGQETSVVRAPATGVVTFIRGVPSIWKGATLVNVGRVLTEPPPYSGPRR